MGFPGSARATREGGGAGRTPSRPEGIEEVRSEGLTGRQLRMARRLAQKHGLQPKSDFDAVRLLRAQGIDPFDRANLLELVVPKEPAANAPGPATDGQLQEPRVGTGNTLPQKIDPPGRNLPGPVVPPDTTPGLHEIERIQRDIVRRRRRNMIFLGARLAAFVLLPTLVAFWYFAFVATPSYSTKSNFVVQQAETNAGPAGLFGGTAMASAQDSIMVQDYLTSREVLQKLDADHGYRSHFSQPWVDPLQRLPANPTNEQVYRHFRQHVKVGFDPTEGVLRMEVTALSPEMSQKFSEALIHYAEERVDQVTERKRADQMKGARESYDEAEAKMVAAQDRVVALQQKLGVLDPTSETQAVMQQVNTFEVQMAQKKLQLQQLLDNPKPNAARVSGVKGDISRLESLVKDLRSQMTNQNDAEGSLAAVSAQLKMAQVDLETRTAMMQESLKTMEQARVEANRQVRFLSTGMAPVPPDEPTYPKVFEDTLIAFLIFAAIYLMASLTVSVLREQVST